MTDKAPPADDKQRTADGKFAKGASGNPRGRAIRAEAPAPSVAEQLASITSAPPRSPSQVDDSWESVISGIGSHGRDKRLTHQFTTDHISYAEAIALWTSDDIAKRAIEGVPDECMRAGYEISIPGDQGGDVEYLEGELERLKADEAIRITHCRERALGGGGILLGANDGQGYDQPLDLSRVTALDFLTPFEPIIMQPLYYYNRASSPKYGLPSHYMINPMTLGTSVETAALSLVDDVSVVHESRIIAYHGIRVSHYQPISGTAGWGYSMFTRIRAVLRDFQVACAAAGILAADFSQAIFKMEGLADFVSKNTPEKLRNRLAAVELARSVARAILIDTKESFERQTTNIQGLPELLAWLSSRLAAAIEMPLTLLMGQSPKGLGNEGESDIRFYYDQVAGIQVKKVEPALRRIISILMQVRARRQPAKLEIKFRPLWQLSEKDKSSAHFTQAQADDLYVNMGSLSAEEVRAARFGGEYSYDTVVATTESIESTPIPTDPATLAALGYAPTIANPAAVVTSPPGGASTDIAKTALSGQQIQSMLAIVTAVNTGAVHREQARGMLTTAFQISSSDADAVLGPAPVTAAAPLATPTAPPAPKAPPMIPPPPAPAAPAVPGVP